MLYEEVYGAIQGRQLIGIDVSDGGIVWSPPSPERIDDAMIDATGSAVYVSRFGEVEAFRLPNPHPPAGDADAPDMSPQSIWSMELGVFARPALMPLPGGGLVVSARRQVWAVSTGGEVRWELELPGSPADWTLAEDTLILSTVGGDPALWSIDEAGAEVLAEGISGRPVSADGQLFVYANDGVYRVNPETRSAELLYPLAPAVRGMGDMVALPEGGLLVAHADLADRRLIALDYDGRVRWERSIAGASRGQQRLLVSDGRVYLMSQREGSSRSEIAISLVDVSTAELVRIFSGSAQSGWPGDTWMLGIRDGRLLVNMGGTAVFVLDPRLALEGALGGASSPE
jgi:hypothetical protein